MKAKKHIMWSIIIASIIITACGLNMSSTVNDGSDSFTSDRITGIEGLELKFVENMPPREIWLDNPFQVGVELRNKGAGEVTEGFVSLHSTKANMWTITPAIAELEISEPLRGRTTFDSDGGYLFEIFDVVQASNADTKEIRDNFFYDEFNLVACYGYKTVASQEICVGPTMLQNPFDKENLCEPSKVYGLGSQGAPVAVSKIERFTVTQKGDDTLEYYPYFTFEIQNVGKGNVRTIASDCVNQDNINVSEDIEVTFSGESNKDRNITGPDGNTNKPASIKCDEVPLTEIEKRSILKKITCRSEKALDISRGKYTTPLIIKVNYGYRDSNTIKVKVNKNIADLRCNGKSTGDDCDDNQKCSVDLICVPKCDYYHTNEAGWKCRSVGECDLTTTCDADAWCKVGYCPLGEDFVCCNPGKKGFAGDDECFGQIDGYACASYKVCKAEKCITKCEDSHPEEYYETGGSWFCRTKIECNNLQQFSDCDTLDYCQAGKCPGADVCCLIVVP